MRSVEVYINDKFAGLLSEVSPSEYRFRYDDQYFNDASMPSISATLPKTQQEYKSDRVFPFFTNMLPEGGNRHLVCRRHKVDEADFFGMLVMMRGADFIGAVNLR